MFAAPGILTPTSRWAMLSIINATAGGCCDGSQCPPTCPPCPPCCPR